MATAGQFPKDAGDTIYAADLEALRRIKQVTAGSYELNVDHVGKHVYVTASITVPPFSSNIQAGDAITIYNGTNSAIPIGTNYSLAMATYFIAGTTITPVILGVNGLATFLCVDTGSPAASPKYVVIGAGLS